MVVVKNPEVVQLITDSKLSASEIMTWIKADEIAEKDANNIEFMKEYLETLEIINDKGENDENK